MKSNTLIIVFLLGYLSLKCNPDTVILSFLKYSKSFDINESCKIMISYTDSFGNKIVIRPKIQNGYIYTNGLEFLGNCKIEFSYKRYHFSFNPAILIFDTKVNWTFGIDTIIDGYFKEHAEFMDRIPSKHRYYYLKMEPLYEGLGYTEYKFIGYRKKRGIKRR